MSVIALDPGINSLGASYYDEEGGYQCRLHMFPSRYDRKGNSKQKVRGEYRRSRRQNTRSKDRNKKIEIYFDDLGVKVSQDQFSRSNPYAIRAKGIRGQLTSEEQLIVAKNFSVNRGFLSSHTDDKDAKDTYKKVQEKEEQIASLNLTPGEFMAENLTSKKEVNSFLRSTVHKEYQRIAEKQKEYDCDLLSGIEEVVFFQRKPYFDENTISDCLYDLKEKVTQKSRREYQKYKIANLIDLIRVIDNGKSTSLSNEVKVELFEIAMQGKTTTWKKLRKIINKPEATFSHETSEKGIFPSETDRLMNKKCINWSSLSENDKDEVVGIILEGSLKYKSCTEISQIIVDRLGLEEDVAKELASVELDSERSNISLKSINRYFSGENLKHEIPDMSGIEYAKKVCNNDILISNVQHSIGLLREFLNEDLDKIFVEVVADPFVEKEEVIKFNKKNRYLKSKAEEWLESNGYRVTRSNVEKRIVYLDQKGRTAYSDEPIDQGKLYTTSDYNFDHIIPRCKSCDNARGNLVLEKRYVNSVEKDDKLLSEWLSEEDLKSLVNRAKEWGVPGQIERILLKSVPNSFCARDLTQTSYSARLLIESLKAEIRYNKLNIEVVAVTGEIVSRFRRELNWRKDREIHYHHMEDASIIATVCSKENLKDGLNLLKENSEIILESARRQGNIKIVNQRSKRGGFTSDKIEKMENLQSGKNKFQKVGGVCRDVSKDVKCLVYNDKNKRGTYNFEFENLWESMSGKHRKDNLLTTLSVNELVKVVDGKLENYYFLKEVDGLRLHPLHLSKVDEDGKKDRTGHFSLKQKGLKFKKPEKDDIKKGVRLVVEKIA